VTCPAFRSIRACPVGRGLPDFAVVRVYLGSDHAGFELKAHLLTALAAGGHEVVDVGATEYDEADAYPPFCTATAERVLADPGALGVVIGGSGNGEQIAANKVKGIRAALAWNTETAQLARQHNDAQVVSIGARMHTADEATTFVEAFLATEFEGGRHQHRIDMLTEYENTGHITS
jgi:ribose 5-phosphate isomerase B